MTAAKRQELYAFVPGCMCPDAAAHYCGQLSVNAFQDEMRKAGIASVPLTARRRGYLKSDLDAWLEMKAGRGVASDPFVDRMKSLDNED